MLAVLAASVAAAQLFPPEDATANSADGGEVVDTSDEHNHNVILRVVRVTPDWHGYTTRGGWPDAVVVKESEALKYFEVAIWEETKSIHLYEFDNDFDPYSWSSTPEQLTAHRESYAIERVPGLPAAGSDTRSLFIKQAFAGFTSDIVSRYPDSEHHLLYSGHGGPGGLLFGAQLLYQDANDMLAHWTYRLGRPLGVVDMGGPCSKSSFSDLENFCQYTRYYISSDLPNGGYSFDDWTIEKHHEVDPESQYHRLFAETSNIKDALIGRINLKRKAYEYSRNNMIASRTAQANYLYSCSDFFDFSKNFKAFLHETSAQYSIWEDLYNYMVRNQASHTLIENFSDVIVHRADNKDFFQWEESRNGMLMPSPHINNNRAPRIPADGIVLATGAPAVNRISPNALISVFGQDLAPQGTLATDPALNPAGRVAANLAATCLETGGKRAPLFVVTPGQINAQVPHDLAPGEAALTVIRGCGTANEQRSAAASATVAAVSPAFFNLVNNADGRNPLVALHGGGRDLAGATDLGAAFTPAEPGKFVTLFGTGFGATEPPLATGQIPGEAVNLANTVAFAFGGIAVPPQDVFYAGASPCCAGLYQFTVRVPANLPDGDATVTAVVQGVSTPEGPYLTVRRPQ